MSRIHEATIRRKFYDRVEPDLNSGCHLWSGLTDECGYGRVKAPLKTRAHRVAYLWNVGPIPDGHVVMHKCDTPACVNPDHLVAGTQLENIADRGRKGRSSGGSNKGESSPLAKMSKEDVARVFVLKAQGQTNKKIASQMPVGEAQIGRILNRKRWN